MGGGVIERRRHNRIKALLDQEGVALVRYKRQMFPASLANLSADGALLRFPCSPPGLEAGAVVSLWLDSGGTLLKVEAVIVRSEPGHVAVQFHDLATAERDEIRTKVIRMEIITARLEKQSMPPASDSKMTGAAR